MNLNESLSSAQQESDNLLSFPHNRGQPTDHIATLHSTPHGGGYVAPSNGLTPDFTDLSRAEIMVVCTEMNAIHEKLKRELRLVDQRAAELDEREAALANSASAEATQRAVLAAEARLTEEYERELETHRSQLVVVQRDSSRLRDAFATLKRTADEAREHSARCTRENVILRRALTATQARLTNLHRLREAKQPLIIPPKPTAGSSEQPKTLHRTRSLVNPTSKSQDPVHAVSLCRVEGSLLAVCLDWLVLDALESYCMSGVSSGDEKMLRSLQDRCLQLLPGVFDLLRRTPDASLIADALSVNALRFVHWALHVLSKEQASRLAPILRRFGEFLFNPEQRWNKKKAVTSVGGNCLNDSLASTAFSVATSLPQEASLPSLPNTERSSTSQPGTTLYNSPLVANLATDENTPKEPEDEEEAFNSLERLFDDVADADEENAVDEDAMRLLIAELEEIGEVCRDLDDRQQSTINGVHYSAKTKAFFKSSNLRVRMISTLIIIRTVNRADIVSAALAQLDSDVRTSNEARLQFLALRAVDSLVALLESPHHGKRYDGPIIDIHLVFVQNPACEPRLLALLDDRWCRAAVSLLRGQCEERVAEKMMLLLQRLAQLRQAKRSFDRSGLTVLLREMLSRAPSAATCDSLLAINLRSVVDCLTA